LRFFAANSLRGNRTAGVRNALQIMRFRVDCLPNALALKLRLV